MPTAGSITRTIRFNPDDLRVIEEIMKEGDTFNGAVHKIISSCVGTPIKKEESNSEVLKDIESMALLSDMDLDEVLEEVDRLMNDGVLMLTGERIEVDLPEWATRFDEACHDRGLPTERVAESAIKAIQKGML